MTEPVLLVTQHERVRRLTFNRPAKLNAFDTELRLEFFRAVDDAVADDRTHVIVLAGAGRAFSSGADVSSGSGRSAVLDAPADMVANKARLDSFLRLWSLPKPLIAQVHGYCLGMANDIVGCCDLVVCGESARVGMPEVREMALPPTLGFWPAKIGLARTKELLWTGRLLDGREAVALGLANDVVPDDELADTVDRLAAKIAEVALPLLAVTKQAANAWFETFGVRSAVLGGAEYHALYHQASSYASGEGSR